MFIIVLILMLAGFTLINVYLASGIFKWVKAIWPRAKGVPYGIVYAFFPVCLIAGQTLPLSAASRAAKVIGNYWMGAFLYILMAVVIFDLLRAILKRCGRTPGDWLQTRRGRAISGAAVAAVIVCTLFYGAVHFNNITTAEYEVNIEKKCQVENLRVALVSDIHLGSSVSMAKVKETVTAINRLKPDIVCIPGDIFDNGVYQVENRDEIAEAFAQIKSGYGVYACLGNHDISAYAKGAERETFYRFFDKAGWKILNDQPVILDNSFYLIGRMDGHPISRREAVQRAPVSKLMSRVDQALPVIMMDHRPDQLTEAHKAGIDLQLSGHTHNGQIFPGNLIVKLINENGYGYKKIDGLHSVVTSGVGIWGPPLRIGSNTEIALLNVHFQK